jgi:aspartate racemase
MYTSGSTGQPKGVEIPHRGIVRLVFGQEYAAFGPEEVFLHLAPFSFDAATFEIWGALLHGARCVLFPEGASFLQHLREVVREYRITTLWLTSSLFNTVVDAVPASLRGVKQLLIGGEALSVGHVLRAMEALPGTVVVNGYGPTESTTFTCCHRVVRSELEGTSSVPIGAPIANTEVYVLDRYRQPVPVGVPGELYIGGDGLARGYRNRPELTREAFVDHPFRSGAWLYRSGDIVRWSPRGYLEFLGRADDQVKIRGFRIEPGEIAVALRSHLAVQDACVVCVGPASEKKLIAYFVPRQQHSADVGMLREFLKARLPAHMVPSLLVEVDALPLTANGKIDVRALPQPAGTPSDKACEPPRDRVEQTLHAIWSELLPERRFGVRDNFFELGGHSLLAARMFLEIDGRLDRSVPLATLFHAPTIEALAEAIRGDAIEAGWSPLVAIQPKGSKPPFFAVHGVGGNILSYRPLANHLAEDQPFYGLQARGLDGKTPPHTSVEDMAADYLREIRRLQPAGPYYIGGLSFGCSVAFEIAQRLRSEGEEVALLALLDGGLRRAKDLLPRQVRLRRVARFQLSRLRMHIDACANLRPQDMSGFLHRKGTTLTRRLRSLVWQFRYLGYESAGAELPAHLRRVEEGAYLAAKRYVPRYYDGHAVLFRSVDGPRLRFVDEQMGWGTVIRGGLEVRRVPGDHVTMSREPHVRVLARELTAALEVARQRSAAT